VTIHPKENEIGFDTTKIGFPGLGSCMGIVLHTDHGLFGFHAYGNNNPKGEAFDRYCRGHTRFGTALHLYGSALWDNRYAGANKFLSWVEEMTFVARQLNYRGRVSGFDLSNKASGVPAVPGESAFLVYKRHPTTSTVSLAFAESKNLDQTVVIDPSTTVRHIRPDKSIATPYKDKVVQTVKPKAGHSLSTVGDDGFYSFILP
jgi:hypothetical protein